MSNPLEEQLVIAGAHFQEFYNDVKPLMIPSHTDGKEAGYDSREVMKRYVAAYPEAAYHFFSLLLLFYVNIGGGSGFKMVQRP